MSQKNDQMIVRTKYVERACHWTLVVCFIFEALSGLSFFFPSLHWLSYLLGTPQLARIIHPFLGVVIFLLLLFLFCRFVKYNIFEKEDVKWFVNIKEVMKGNEHKIMAVGKYNPGQKMMFWGAFILLVLLLISGIILWRPFFASYFSVPVLRWSLLVHSVMGVLMIFLILGHVYTAVWVKGTISGMISGKVSRIWAKKHHPKWYQQVLSQEQDKV